MPASTPPGLTARQSRRLRAGVLPRLAVLGDSIPTASSEVGAGYSKFSSKSLAGWVCAFLQGDITYEHGGNFGVIGDTTEMIMARIPALLAYGPGVVLVNGNVNDNIPGTILPSVTIANMITTDSILLASGIVVARILGADCNGARYPAGREVNGRRQLKYINSMYMQWARTQQGLVVINPDVNLSDPATGQPLSGYTPDGLHWLNRAVVPISADIASSVRPLIPRAGRGFSSFNDVYDAINLTGNRLSNGLMVGSTAVSGVAFATGSTASQWPAYAYPASAGLNSALVYSKEARPRGLGDWLVITAAGLVGGTATETAGVRQTLNLTGLVAGDVLRSSVEFDWTPGAGFRSIFAVLSELNPAGNINYSFGEVSTGDLQPANESGGWLTMPLPPCTIRPGTTSMTLSVAAVFDTTAAASGTLKIGAIYTGTRP